MILYDSDSPQLKRSLAQQWQMFKLSAGVCPLLLIAREPLEEV